MDSSESPFSISGISVAAGETREIDLKVSESYLSRPIQIPVTVIRGTKPGPTAFVMGAIHGNEINGADIVRRLIFDVDHEKICGTLIAIPVVNVQGFLGQTRYLPYNRDLNRYFPGDRKGNNAERIAARLFKEVVLKCDFGVDLHTAADGRSNLPHVRGDMTNPKVRELARAFGSTVLVNQPGVRGSLRREATNAGVPTILFEAGETSKFSPKISVAGLRGVLNVLQSMAMWTEHQRARPPFQVIVKSSSWIRAEKGGILHLDVRPGELIYEDDLIGTILNPWGKTVTKIRAPLTGIVIGVTTAPLTTPGTGIAHVARLKKALPLVERAMKRLVDRRKASKAKRGAPKKRKRKATRAAGMIAAIALFGGGTSGCGALSTTMLRHQTGESLGPGKIKISGRLESARMTPVVDSSDPGAQTAQSTDVFQAAAFGVQGEIGALPGLDFQLATNYAKGGGGWRIGAKYELKRAGPIAIAVMVGYGSYFGAGDVTYLTTGQPETLSTTLAAQVGDFGFPISYRFSPAIATYSGLTFYHASVKGSVGSSAVSASGTDTGLNLGLRITSGRVEGDLEGAYVRVSDPFTNGSRFVPFFGISIGVLF